MAKKYVYFFGNGKAEGNPKLKEILGGKGANLAEMSKIGIPVPAGFTITTEVCDYYGKNKGKMQPGVQKQIDDCIKKMERAMGAKFGDAKNPLLVSVRSGAAVSMPGMMDTVLNLGLNDIVVEGMAKKFNNERLAWDSYRRFIDMFGDVVMGVGHHHFEEALTKLKTKVGAAEDTDLSVDDLKALVKTYKAIYKKHVKKDFPTSAKEQLTYSIGGVFESWGKDKAVVYRKINKFTGLLGTAVNVQAMVFGNMGDTSGTGVAFTRDPNSGENVFFGEYLVNAQGEDVVAGIRTPEPIAALKKRWPKVYRELDAIRKKLEKHYKEMQDVEFTIQEGTLYMLQTRTGKRNGLAAVRIATEMVKEKLINDKTALLRVAGDDLNQMLFPILDAKVKNAAIKAGKLLGTALPAGPGAATGVVCFTPDAAEKLKAKGKKVILVRHETSPEDVAGMWAAEGILTATGGMTSHAAVVARGWGKCCVVGMGELKIDEKKGIAKAGNKTIKAGDEISLDGNTGEAIIGGLSTAPSPVIEAVVSGKAAAKKHPLYKQFSQIMTWSDKYRKLNVRTNADSPNDSKVAVALGAEGIGLCRTEHMFFEGDRIWAIREFILSEDEAGRAKALKKLLPYQRKDFEGIFKAMDGKSVTVRLLDPPLHEFIPHDADGQKTMAKKMKITPKKVKELVEELHEFNPMLGHRGCRLSITYPELCVMQTTAIIEAAINASKKKIKALPEIMIPLIGTKKELDYLAAIVRETADAIIKAKKSKVKYMVGTMIEIPRAALVADKIAESAEFFSFGTNDLTQMTFGYSRDDSGVFLPEYQDKGILPADPFQTIDQDGVGQLVEIAVERGKKTRKNIKLGICGEHGGEPESVKFCHRTGLNYVSCSPYRVPIARLAAAQAVLEK